MSFDAEQLDFEQQGRVRWNASGSAPRAVCDVAGAGEHRLAPDLHQLHAFGPTLDHAVERKGRRASALDAAVEDLAVLETLCVPLRYPSPSGPPDMLPFAFPGPLGPNLVVFGPLTQ